MKRPSIVLSDRWYVQLDGVPVAIIENPVDADMFWFTWDVAQVGEAPIPPDLWEYANDSRRSFRHLETSEMDPVAFPGGNGLLESGRVLIRGPLRNRATDGSRLIPTKNSPCLCALVRGSFGRTGSPTSA